MGIRCVGFEKYGFDSFLNVVCTRVIHDEEWHGKYLNKSNFAKTNLGLPS